jgi:NAD(P)-dependent dehydrogenase (short-subunit alcohol dehydrogenase family)
MDDFRGKVAVVTGGGSGIGRSLAHAFARRGCRISLADVEEPALEAVVRELEGAGAEVLALRVDVGDPRDVARLADATFDRFGAAHLLCNNAGVGAGGYVRDLPLEEWSWVLRVNLHGVIHGLHAFLPRMLASGEPCHVVNTASLAGLVSLPGLSPYSASKYAVVAISEALARECEGTRVGVSVLCPGWVRTRIAESERHAGPELAARPQSPEARRLRALVRGLVAGGIEPDEVARRTLEGIERGELYILPGADGLFDAVRSRFDAVLKAAPAAG